MEKLNYYDISKFVYSAQSKTSLIFGTKNLTMKEKIRIYILVCLVLISTLTCLRNQNTTGDDKDSISELKKLYDTGEYDNCINACKKLIKSEAKTLIKNNNHIFLAKVYELQADCLERKGYIDQSIETIKTLLSKLGQSLPKDYLARIKLKIGHIYKQAGLYSKALLNFKKVEQEYNRVFPNRFAKYARENYNEIISKQVAVISGTVSLEDNKDSSGVTIKVFNGYEESETESMQNGEYSIPLFSSTPGTMFSLFAYKRGYNPAIINKRFDGTSDITIRELQLKRSSDENAGIIAGVVFTVIGGGKITPHHGIGEFREGYKIKFHKFSENRKTGEIFSVTADDNGIYKAFLTPGVYLSYIRGMEKIFELKRNEVKILNISRPGRLVD